MSQTFKHRRIIEFRDTDMAGIVHFSNFFSYMEQAEHAFLRSVDLGVFCEIDGESAPKVSLTILIFGVTRSRLLPEP